MFTRETEENLTVDVSEGLLTNIQTIADDSLINYHPVWCGNDHVMWSREIICTTCELSELYWWELCIQAVDEGGPEGSPTCYLGSATHLKANQHPSCNVGGDMVAFAQSNGDRKDAQTLEYIEQPHQICTMDLLAGSQQEIEDSVRCLSGDSEVDDTNPVWKPGNTMLAFASQRMMSDDTTDYEIWQVNSVSIETQTPQFITDNDQEIPDLDPDWGG